MMNLPGEIKSFSLEAVVTRNDGTVEDLGLVAFAHQDKTIEDKVRSQHPEWGDHGRISVTKEPV